MDFRVSDVFDSAEDFEHLAHVHSARPRFQNPVKLMKMKMEEGITFDVDEMGMEDGIDDEEEVYDDDVLSMFSFGSSDLKKDERINADDFNVEEYGRETFLETEAWMTPLNEDGTVMKMIIRPGSNQKVPKRSKLYFHFAAICEGAHEAFDTSMARKYPYVVDLRKSTTTPGLELALKSMSLSEVARFIVYPEMAYGKAGCPPRILPNAKVMYVIQMLQFIDEAKLSTTPYMTSDERNQLPFETIVAEARKFRADGNSFYKNQSYSFAIKKWRKAANFLEDYNVTSEEDDKIRRDLIWTLYSNLAQGYLRLERPAQACSACKIGLKSAEEHGDSSVKLLYRFAKAKLMLKDVDAALRLVEEALKIEPKNKESKQLRKEILAEQGKGKEAYKQMCHSMFRSNHRSKGESSSKTRKENPVQYGIVKNVVANVEDEQSDFHYFSNGDTREFKFELDDFVADFQYCSPEQIEKAKAEMKEGKRLTHEKVVPSVVPVPCTSLKLKPLLFADFKMPTKTDCDSGESDEFE